MKGKDTEIALWGPRICSHFRLFKAHGQRPVCPSSKRLELEGTQEQALIFFFL